MVWSASKLRYHQVEKTLIYHEKQPSGNRGLFVFHVKQSFISG